MTGRLGSRRAYSGKVISLDVDEVAFPDGSTGELEIIRHPGASAIVPVLGESRASDPRILLIRQYRYAAEGYLFEIPAGRLDHGEDPRACAARELAEETGYSAGNIEHIFTMYTTPGFTDEKIHLFIATDLKPGESRHEADEFLDLHPTLLSEAVRMVGRGDIRDAKTALGILFTAEFHFSR